jgi:hypothetical protein
MEILHPQGSIFLQKCIHITPKELYHAPLILSNTNILITTNLQELVMNLL